jgi:putative transposase
MKINQGFKFRLKVNESEAQKLEKYFGCARFIYNHILALKINDYDEGFSFGINFYIKLLPDLKNDYPWLRDVDATILQQALRDLDSAYKKFFNEKKGFPNFKSKKRDKPSFRVASNINNIRIEKNKIKCGKIGFLRIFKAKERLARLPKGRTIKNITISRDSDQYYYISICVEYEKQVTQSTGGNIVGVDLGIKNNYVVRDDNQFYHLSNPQAYEKEFEKLKKLQQRLSRKVKGSKNREKAKIKVAKQHFRIKSIRQDFNHQISKALVDTYDVIVLEDLNLESMKQKNLGRQVSDLTFYQFRTFLDYKTKFSGKNLVLVDRYFPSSKLCSSCGSIKKDLTLKDRVYSCSCGNNTDRDENASMNLYQAGLCYLANGVVPSTQDYISCFNLNTAGSAEINACGDQSLDYR